MRKEKRFIMRIADSHAALLNAAADSLGISTSELVRRAAIEAASLVLRGQVPPALARREGADLGTAGATEGRKP